MHRAADAARTRTRYPDRLAEFPRGVGLPDFFIEYAASLVDRPIEYYSVFISYSSKDEVFAQRLYVDLQAARVRWWFVPEDLTIGEKIRPGIDGSIRLHD
jgi:TIR domain